MKKLLFFAGILMFTSISYSQVIFGVVAPQSAAQEYDFTYPTNWPAMVNMDDPVNAVVESVVLYDNSNNDGCSNPANGAELSGKVALIKRGTCEFGQKVLNAENAGAVAVIVMNNLDNAELLNMGAGDFGATVTIPAIFISKETGDAIITLMQSEDVVVFIGNKQGYYEHDLGMEIGWVIRPQYSSIPSLLIEDTEDFAIPLGALFKNYGSEGQGDVQLNAVISFNGVELYNETSSAQTLASGAESQAVLPSFQPETWEPGYYSLTYTLTGEFDDENSGDNVYESDFIISADQVLSYAKIDQESGESNAEDYYRYANSDAYSSCIHFMDEFASVLAPSAISFYAVKGSSSEDPSLEGEEFFVEVYLYNDQFEDIDDAAYTNVIGDAESYIAKSYTFEDDLQEVLITVPFDNEDVQFMEDYQRYLFCVTTFNPEVYLGHDPKRDYNVTLSVYKQPLFPAGNDDGINSFGFSTQGHTPQIVPSIMVYFTDELPEIDDNGETGINEEMANFNMGVYPSPASDLMTVRFDKNIVDKIEVVNLMGQVITVVDVNVTENKVKVDVSNFDNGVYFVRGYKGNSVLKTMKFVVAH